MGFLDCCTGKEADVKQQPAATSPAPPAPAAAPAAIQTPAPKEVAVEVIKPAMSVNIWIIYYSMYGHIRKMAEAYKEGIESVDGVKVTVLQVPETLPSEVLEKMHAPAKAADPVADPHKLPEADAFVFGAPTRYGTVAGQMKAFIDATGSLWAKGALIGKPYALFTSTATQNGGQETTFISFVNNFTHHGMIYVPAGYVEPGTQFDLTDVHGGSPWGAGCLAGPDGSRQPSEKELALARTAGKNFAVVAKKLKAPSV